eukprot:g3452.t1
MGASGSVSGENNVGQTLIKTWKLEDTVWEEYMDTTGNQKYFYNPKTGETKMDAPWPVRRLILRERKAQKYERDDLDMPEHLRRHAKAANMVKSDNMLDKYEKLVVKSELEAERAREKAENEADKLVSQEYIRLQNESMQLKCRHEVEEFKLFIEKNAKHYAIAQLSSEFTHPTEMFAQEFDDPGSMDDAHLRHMLETRREHEEMFERVERAAILVQTRQRIRMGKLHAHMLRMAKIDYEREDEIRREMIQQRDRRVRYEKDYKEAKERARAAEEAHRKAELDKKLQKRQQGLRARVGGGRSRHADLFGGKPRGYMQKMKAASLLFNELEHKRIFRRWKLNAQQQRKLRTAMIFFLQHAFDRWHAEVSRIRGLKGLLRKFLLKHYISNMSFAFNRWTLPLA